MASSDDDARAATISAGAPAAVDASGATVAAPSGGGSGGSGGSGSGGGANDGGTLASISDLSRVRRAIAEAPIGDEDATQLQPVDPKSYARGETLAVGGMGRIVAARDRRLGRKVAIKEVRAGSADLRRRFEREAVLTARLQHPNIITVHEAGTWPDGEPFFAMKLVAGRSLDKVVAERKTLAERLALLPAVIAVADALAYAHKERVIHRDLKPANVLVGDFGETVVIDWGLAKDLAATESGDDHAADDTLDAIGPYREAAAGGETAYGAVIGTPAYMPPEQARGEAVDERADVYSLGALLYHVLGGRPPVEGASVEDVIASVITKRVQPVRTLDARIPIELDTIIHKAMAPSPDERYPTAVELAEDLRRFQTGQLVGAHHYTPWQLVRRWIVRRRAPLAIAAIAAVILAVGGGLSVSRVLHERDAASRSTRALLVEDGRREALDQHPLRALALLGEAIGMGEATDDLRYLVARTLPFAETAVQRYALPDTAITSAAFSPDDHHVITTSNDGHVRVWDALTAAVLHDIDVHPAGRTIVLGGEHYAALRTPEGDSPYMQTAIVDLATGTTGAPAHTRPVAFDEGGERVWRFDAATMLDHAGQHEEIAADWGSDVIAARAHGADLLLVTASELVRLHDDGRAITVAARAQLDGGDIREAVISAALDRVALRRGANVEMLLADGTPVGEFTDRLVPRFALRDDGTQIAFLTEDSDVRLTVAPWGPVDAEAAAAAPHARVPCAGDVVSMAYSGDGKSLLVQCSDPMIFVLDPKTSGVRAALTAEVDTLTVAISRDGRYVLAALRDGSSELWDVTKARDLPNIGKQIVAAAYDDGEHVVATEVTGFVRDGQPSVETRPDRERPGDTGDDPESPCAFDAPSGTVACAGTQTIDVFGRADTRHPRAVLTMPDHVLRLALSRAGERVAVHTETTITIFDGALRTASWPAPAGFTDTDSFAFDPDGGRLLRTTAARGELDVLDVATGAMKVWPAPDLAFARWAMDGTRVITVDAHGKVQLRDARDGSVLVTFAHSAPVKDFALAARNTLLFTASDDGTVREWNATTGEHLRDIRVSPNAVDRVAADPAGERVATASESNEIALWSVTSGEMLQRLASVAPSPFHALEFSRSGARLLAVDDDVVVRQWDTSLDRRALPDVRALVERFVPWTVVDGRVQPRKLTSAPP